MKLQSKIIVLLIPAIVIPMLALGWSSYEQLRSTIQQKNFDQMNSLLNQTEFILNSNVKTAKSNIELFANSSLIKRYVRTTDQQDRFSLIQPTLLRLFVSYQKAYPQYYDIRLLLPDGVEDTWSSSFSMIESQKLSSNLFSELSLLNKDLHTRYIWSEEKKEFSLLISKRIKLIDQYFEPSLAVPRIRGYLVMFADLNILRQQIVQKVVGSNGYVFLTDAQGRLVMHPDHNKQFTLLSEELFEKLQQITQSNGYISGFHQGHNFLFKGKQIDRNLFVFTALPEIEIIAASRNLGLLIASISLLIIFITSTLLFVLLKHLIVKPISNLKNAAQEISNGQLEVSIVNQSTDEIGELAHSFNEMSKSLRQSTDQIYYLAYHDSLTGLPNRRKFLEMLGKTLIYSKEHNQRFALMFLDLDDFKRVNDTLGHDVGDELLKDFSARLTGCLRVDEYLTNFERAENIGSVSRLGGDEFIFLLQDIEDSQVPAQVAERILNLVTHQFIVKNHEIYISTSIGLTMYPEDGDNIDVLVKNADIAMYSAKSKGKNNFQAYHPYMNADAVEQLSLENDLRKAIPDNQLLLHYQPKINAQTGKMIGVEALVRWRHPIQGLLGPDKFISLAETSGLIAPLSEWVLMEACKQNRSWQLQGFPPLSMAVNISNSQFEKHDLLNVVRDILKQTGLKPDNLELELTETSIMQEESSAIDILMAIKDIGVTIAMDDFGTGYSSLNALRRFPIDCLKIDRSFIKGIINNSDDAAIVSAIISMAKCLKMQIVAEGIEDKKQLELLQNQGCDVIQGYLISKPITAEKMNLLFEAGYVFPTFRKLQSDNDTVI